MTKPSIRSTSHKPQHSGSPRKTQLIKFRVTPQEKRELGQCGKIGSNLNQLARHFNSGGKDSEQIRAQRLTELSALALFRLDAEKKMGELYGNH